MKYYVTDLNEENEIVAFTNNILENYFSESFLGSFPAQCSPFPVDYVSSQTENFSQTNASSCINIVEYFVNKPNDLFWTLYFDGSKSNDGAGAGCILINSNREKNHVFLQVRV